MHPTTICCSFRSWLRARWWIPGKSGSNARDDDFRAGAWVPRRRAPIVPNTPLINCGKGTLTREHPSKPGTFQYLRATCKRFSCPHCGPEKKKHYKAAIFEARKTFRLQRHVVLTLDPGLIPPNLDSIEYIQRVWTRFRSWIAQHKGIKFTYLRTIELQQNGTAHFHLIWRECISQDELIEAWRACGGGHQCRIRWCDGNRGASYIAKYISKELVTELRPGTRRVACSHGVVLFQPTLPSGWTFNPLSFYDCMAFALGLSWTDAYTSSIDRYFEAESPPEDKSTWATIDGRKDS